MAKYISMVLGGILLILGIAFLVISSLYLAGSTTGSSVVSEYVVLFFLGIVVAIVGVFMLFVPHIAKNQI